MRSFKFTFLFLCSFCIAASAQTNKPEWKLSSTKPAGGKLILNIAAAIPAGMIIYSNSNSQDLPNTNIEFDSSIAGKIKVIGNLQEGELKKKDAQLENVEVGYFEKSMKIGFELQLESDIPALKGKINYMGFNGKEFVGPESFEFYLKKQPDGSYAGGEFQLNKSNGKELLLSTVDLKHPISNCGIETPADEHTSLLVVFFLGFAGGLIALITPCVFPMIPLTVSFFLQRRLKAGRKVLVMRFCMDCSFSLSM